MIADTLKISFGAKAPTGLGAIYEFMFYDPRYQYIMRPLENEDLPSNLGGVDGHVLIFIGWQNIGASPMTGHIEASLVKADGTVVTPAYRSGNDVVANPLEVKTVTFKLPVVLVPPNQQGTWGLTGILTDANTGDVLDSKTITFIVGTIQPPLDYAVWEFPAAGYFPRQLPSSFTGEVILADLDPASIPPEVQGVYGPNNTLWAPGAPGATLVKLVAGIGYGVSVSGPCVWNIPLGEGPGPGISGKVYYPHAGTTSSVSKPALKEFLPDTEVDIGGYKAISDSEGNYQIPDIPSGNYTQTARYVGPAPGGSHDVLIRSRSISIVAGQRLDIPVYPAHSIPMNIGVWLTPQFPFQAITGVRGQLEITQLSESKIGLAGIENTMELATQEGTIHPEITLWRYGNTNRVDIGWIVYPLNTPYKYVRKVTPAIVGERYSYELLISGGTIYVKYANDAGKVIFSDSYPCNAIDVKGIQIPIEYWWQPKEGAFSFKALHVTSQLRGNGVWQNAGEVMNTGDYYEAPLLTWRGREEYQQIINNVEVNDLGML